LATTAVSRQRLGTQVTATVEVLLETVFQVARAADVATLRPGEQVSAATNPDATIEILLETVFSIRFVWRWGRLPPP
jgi:hypothetical protein